MSEEEEWTENPVTITIHNLTFEDGAGPNPRIWMCKLDEGMGRFEIVKHYSPNKNYPYVCYYYRSDKYRPGEEPDWIGVGDNINDCVLKAQKKYEKLLDIADDVFEKRWGEKME